MPSEHVSVEEMLEKIIRHLDTCMILHSLLEGDEWDVPLAITQRTTTEGYIQLEQDHFQLEAESSMATWEVTCPCGWSVHTVEQDGIPAWEMIVRPDTGSEVNN